MSLGEPRYPTTDPNSAWAVVEIGALALLFVVAFLVPTSPELGQIGLRPEDILLVVLTGILAIDLLARPRLTLVGREFFAILALLWVVGVVSSIIGAVLGTAQLLSLNPTHSALLTILKEAEFVALFLLVTRYVRTRVAAHALLQVICAAGTLLAVILLVERIAFSNGALIPPQEFHLMGEIFAFAACLALGRLAFGTSGTRESLLLIAALGVNFVAVLASGEAGAILGMFGAFSVFAFLAVTADSFRIPLWNLAVFSVLGVAIIASVVVFVPAVSHLLGQQISDIMSVLSGNPNPSASARFRHWAERVPAVLANRPILGFGHLAVNAGGIDNEYFQRLYYTGITGLSCYLALLGVGLRTAFSGIDADRTGFLAGYGGMIGVMITAGLAKGIFHSAKTSVFFVFVSSLIFVLLDREGFSHPR